MNRRNFIKKVGLLGAGYAINKNLIFANPVNGGIADSSVPFPIVRKELSERNFSSPAIEKAIATFKKEVKNKELGWLFENCFPNTLDTTVFYAENQRLRMEIDYLKKLNALVLEEERQNRKHK